uniref:Bm13344 n=1 Tax=Brugia malayi TaxID=6279 RepID=A0A1I9G7Y8_BRUMA|nr:Bm13344 [Brugia malayi]
MLELISAAGSNIDGKFDLLWDNDRPISDLVATEMAKAQTHESTLTNCGASAMCNEGLTTLEENSMLFMRNSLHFMKHI